MIVSCVMYILLVERYHSHLKLPLLDAARFYKLINPPQPSFAIKSFDQCKDFCADPNFSLARSLGLVRQHCTHNNITNVVAEELASGCNTWRYDIKAVSTLDFGPHRICSSHGVSGRGIAGQ